MGSCSSKTNNKTQRESITNLKFELSDGAINKDGKAGTTVDKDSPKTVVNLTPPPKKKSLFKGIADKYKTNTNNTTNNTTNKDKENKEKDKGNNKSNTNSNSKQNKRYNEESSEESEESNNNNTKNKSKLKQIKT